MKYVLLIGMLVVFACDRGTSDRADNTKNNADRAGYTAQDQSESPGDRDISQKVRSAVVRDDLSMNARNVKIITTGGVVTLRGPVASDEEKTRVAALAEKTDGVKRVDNQLEVNK